MTRLAISGRAWLASLVTAAVVVAAASFPPYEPRLRAGRAQLDLLEERSHTSYHQLQVGVAGHPYEVVSRVEAATFADAVIHIPDTGADGELARVGWMSWFLYPRVILQSVNLEQTPETEVDFVLMTPTFHPGLPDGARLEGVALIPLSERARRHQESLAP